MLYRYRGSPGGMMLIKKPILRGLTERLKIKLFDNTKLHFSICFTVGMRYWICQHRRLYKIFGFQVLLLVQAKYVAKLQHEASISR